nr:acyltransferase [Parabacteroides merdae]
MDFGNPKRIHLADDVILSNGVTILCHKRDVSQYYRGESALKLPFLYEDVYIERGCQLGLNVTVMPGVHIGEGSIIGTGAVVTKDIPAWSVAVGFPAKVIRQIELIDDNWLIVSELNNRGGGKIDM